jgi:hypothetical protein
MEVEEEAIQVRKGKREEKEDVQGNGEKVNTGLNCRGSFVGLEVHGEEAARERKGQYRKGGLTRL